MKNWVEEGNQSGNFDKYLSFMLRCVDSGNDDTWDNPSSALPNPFLTVSMLTPFVVLSGQHTNEESKWYKRFFILQFNLVEVEYLDSNVLDD